MCPSPHEIEAGNARVLVVGPEPGTLGERGCYREGNKKSRPTAADRAAGPIGTRIGRPIGLEGDPNLEGIAFGEMGRRLYVLNDVDNDVDGDGLADTGEEIQVYAFDAAASALALVSSFGVPAASDTDRFLTDARGLALAEERGSRILYTLSSRRDGTRDAGGKDNITVVIAEVPASDGRKQAAKRVTVRRAIGRTLRRPDKSGRMTADERSELILENDGDD